MTAGPSQTPPPGWYPDPEGSGRQRWWNGNDWTTHFQDAPAGAPAPGWGGPQATARPVDERTWAIFAHISALVTSFVGLAFLGPLVVYLIRRDDSPMVRAHAAAALNFQLSWMIWGISLAIVGFVLMIILIGFLLFIVLAIGAIAWFVITIVATIKASNGELINYPLTIKFVS